MTRVMKYWLEKNMALCSFVSFILDTGTDIRFQRC